MPGLDIQRRTFTFACRIVRLFEELATMGPTQRAVGRQLLDAGTSVGANLEEADAGHSKADFIARCSVAVKEARESRYWLRLLHACDLAPADVVTPLIQESHELVLILTAIRRNARRNDSRG
jgi:four helix bundle protein